MEKFARHFDRWREFVLSVVFVIMAIVMILMVASEKKTHVQPSNQPSEAAPALMLGN